MRSSMDALETDVVIAGAGPVGLTLALALETRGTRATVIESKTEPASTSRALAVWSRTLEHFASLGLDVAHATSVALPVCGAHIYSHDGVRARALTEIAFDDAPSQHGMGVYMPQPQTERLLLDACQARGIEIHRGHTLKSVFDRGDTTECVVAGEGGDRIVRAAFAVGCDGAHSTVRHGMRAEFQGKAVDERFVLADLKLDFGDAPGREVLRIIWHEAGVVAFIPVRAGVWRAIANTGSAPETGSRDVSYPEVRALLEQRARGVLPDGVLPEKAEWLSEFRVQERVATRFREGRIILAGDAAHVHSPVGGQGMNAGIEDAMNLAWKLDLVRSGLAGATLVDTYDAERRAAVSRTVRSTAVALRLALGRPRALARLRNLVVPLLLRSHGVRDRLRDSVSQLSLSYARGVLARDSTRAGKLRAGMRFPNLVAVDEFGAPRPLQGELTYKRFVALGWEDANASGGAFSAVQSILTALPERLRAQTQSLLLTSAAQSTGGVSMLLDPTGAAVAGLGAGSGGLLVRPDGYIAVVSHGGDARGVREFLRAASLS